MDLNPPPQREMDTHLDDTDAPEMLCERRLAHVLGQVLDEDGVLLRLHGEVAPVT